MELSPMTSALNETLHESMSSPIKSIDQELELKQKELALLQQQEHYNETTGLGEDLTGKSIGKVWIMIHKARNLPSCSIFSGKANPYVRISIDPEESCEMTTQQTSTQRETMYPSWEEEFWFEPILSRTASIRVQVMHAEKFRGDLLMGEVHISFSRLLNQEIIENWYPIESEHFKSASLLISTRFTFSTILPLQLEINVLKKLRGELLVSPNDLERKLQVEWETKPKRCVEPAPKTVIHTPADVYVEKDDTELASAIEADYLDDYGVLRRKEGFEVDSIDPWREDQGKSFMETLKDWIFSSPNDSTRWDKNGIFSWFRNNDEPNDVTAVDPHMENSVEQHPGITKWLLPDKQKRRTSSKTHFDPKLLLPMTPVALAEETSATVQSPAA